MKNSKTKDSMKISEFYAFENKTELKLPLYLAGVSAGFPSPADDYIDKTLDLNEFLIEHPSATFFVRAVGDSMLDAGIQSGDILIIDRALEPSTGDVIIAMLNGEFLVKRIRIENSKIFLEAGNPDFETIEVDEEMNFEVWGVVSHVIHSL